MALAERTWERVGERNRLIESAALYTVRHGFKTSILQYSHTAFALSTYLQMYTIFTLEQ